MEAKRHLNHVDICPNGLSLTPCCRQYQSTGDFDGDGRTDIQRQDLFASPAGRFLAGQIQVRFAPENIGAGGAYTVPLTPDGIEGFVIWGAEANDMIDLVGAIPDINGDGLSEIVIRADLDRPDGTEGGGGYFIFGQRQFAPGDFDNDGDVDLSDFSAFSLNFTGPL